MAYIKDFATSIVRMTANRFFSIAMGRRHELRKLDPSQQILRLILQRDVRVIIGMHEETILFLVVIN
jgi:hypothetical protein